MLLGVKLREDIKLPISAVVIVYKPQRKSAVDVLSTLKHAKEQVNFGALLDTNDMVYLSNLIKNKSIKNKHKYTELLKEIKAKNIENIQKFLSLPHLLKQKVDSQFLLRETLLDENQTKKAIDYFRSHKDKKKLSKKESGFNSVVQDKDNPANLYALYLGEEDNLLGRGNFGKIKIAQNIKTKEWVAVKIQKTTDKKMNAEIEKETRLMRKTGMLKARQSRVKGEEKISYAFTPIIFADRLEFILAGTKKSVVVEPWVEKYHAEIRNLSLNLSADGQGRYENLANLMMASINMALTTIDELKKIHDNGILHLDLHRGNILFDDNGNATILDLGKARKFKKENNGVFAKATENKLGRSDTFPPEVVDHKISRPNEKFFFSPQYDIWALGKFIENTCKTIEMIKEFGEFFGLSEAEATAASEVMMNFNNDVVFERPSLEEALELLSPIHQKIKVFYEKIQNKKITGHELDVRLKSSMSSFGRESSASATSVEPQSTYGSKELPDLTHPDRLAGTIMGEYPNRTAQPTQVGGTIDIGYDEESPSLTRKSPILHRRFDDALRTNVHEKNSEDASPSPNPKSPRKG